MQRLHLQKTLQVLLLFFVVFAGLYYAKSFLVPVCFGGLFAMLFLPLSRRFENAGCNRSIAILLCIFILLLIIAGIVSLITWRVHDLTSDLENIEQKVQLMILQLEKIISDTFGISQQQQQQLIGQQTKTANGLIYNLGSFLMSLLVDLILILVYIFLFMYSRTHIKKFILQLIPTTEDANAEDAILSIEKVSQQYLTGIGFMIISLWIMYSIGFSIAGLKNAFFFAILCGLFEIVPFAGNLAGNALAVLMALTQGGGTAMVISILFIYGLVQFFQTYVLEPLVVGSKVNINPLFTIIALVVGELVWGIAGMILAIPLLGIVKIICDHIAILKPYGFLIGSYKSRKAGLVQKMLEKKSG